MGLAGHDDVGEAGEEVRVELVLQTRLGLLRRSLRIVEEAIHSINGARRLNTAAGGRPGDVSKVGDALAAADAALVPLTTSKDPAVSSAARIAFASIATARDALSGGELKPTSPIQFSLLETSLDTDLKGGVKECLRDLAAIETNVGLTQGKDPATRQQILAAAWADYSKLYRLCCETVFFDYVDLIRGVLIRDAGLDDQLCRIADELGRRWGRFGGYEWRSLSIPSSRDWLGMSAAKLIRIGFPEWSVWSVVLTAYEFGHVIAAMSDAGRKLVADTTDSRGIPSAEVQAWVADVFATSILGPAYVWAAILLRANPTSAADGVRVDLMLRTLARISKRDAHVKEQEQIKQAWEQARARVEAGEPGRADLDDVFDEVLDEVWSRILLPLRADDWETAHDKLADALRNAELEPQQIADQLQGSALRTILVAAWEARIRLHEEFADERAKLLEGDDDATEAVRDALVKREHEALISLADRTRKVCIALIDRQPPEGGVGQGLSIEQSVTFEQHPGRQLKPDQPLGVGR